MEALLGRETLSGMAAPAVGHGAAPFEVNLDATRQESSLSPAAVHGIMLRGSLQW